MIDVVLMFGLINVVFEFVLLCMLPIRVRLRVLGNRNYQMLLHVGFLLLNLIVHWGTVLGTMASILSFICSLFTVRVAQIVFGKLVDGRYYTTGLIRYSTKELL